MKHSPSPTPRPVNELDLEAHRGLWSHPGRDSSRVEWLDAEGRPSGWWSQFDEEGVVLEEFQPGPGVGSLIVGWADGPRLGGSREFLALNLRVVSAQVSGAKQRLQCRFERIGRAEREAIMKMMGKQDL